MEAPKVFISCAREDQIIARRLYRDLRFAGLKPWLDVEDLVPGQNWRIAIPQALKESQYVLVLLSSHVLSKRGFAQKELKIALEILDEFPIDQIFLIPVRIDNCVPADARLRELHWVDLFPSYEDGLKQILRVLLPEEKVAQISSVRQQLQELEDQYDLLTEKIQRLRLSSTIETDAATKSNIEKQIQVVEQERKEVAKKIEKLGFKPTERQASSISLHQQIIEFLTTLPNSDEKDMRQALLFRAGLDAALQNQITFSGSAGQFFQLLLPTLEKYGRLEDGRNAIIAVLEAAKSYVGKDRQTQCDRLIQELQPIDQIHGDKYEITYQLPSESPESFFQSLSERTEKTTFMRGFLDKAGFAIQSVGANGDFMAVPKMSFWKGRFAQGVYVSTWFDAPLDHDAVRSICQKAKTRTSHALIVTNQQPAPDGWGEIATLRLNAHPFVVIPVTDSIISEWFISKNERKTFADYIEKYLGKGYNPYDVRDPVSDVLSFFGREGLMDEILSDLQLGKRVGLFGLHKIGKSSVLKMLQKRAEFPVAYVYLDPNSSLSEIYDNIINTWTDDLRLKYPNFSWFEIMQKAKAGMPFKAQVKHLLERLQNAVPLPHLSVFLDEIEKIIPYKAGDEAALNRYNDLMDTLRALQQETSNFSLLAAGVHPKLARVNYFWGNRKNPMHQVITEKFVPPLERNDCEMMIRSLGKQIGIDYDAETIAYLFRKSGAHPYLARQLCSVAYQKHQSPGVMPFSTVQETAEEFVYNPAHNHYFNDNALWGELVKEDLWKKEVGNMNHRILLQLAASKEGLSKADLAHGSERIVFEEAFVGLKERSLICLMPDTDQYHITFGLFEDWIRAHKLQRKEMVWQTRSISARPSRLTNLSGVGIK